MSKCDNCTFARTDRCGFMAASQDKAEAVLIAAGVQYRVKPTKYNYRTYTKTVRLLTVVECPRLEKGSVAV